MGKSTPKTPTPPDPFETAAAQAQANAEAVRESALVNQIAQIGPTGTTRFVGEIGKPDRAQIIELAPSQERQLAIQNALAEQLGAQALLQAGFIPQTQFSLAGAPALDPSTAGAIRGDVFSVFESQIEDRFQRDLANLNTDLANRGIPFDSAAAAQARDDLLASRDRSLRDAYTTALAEGRNELALQQSLRQQAISDLLLERTQPFNEAAAFIQGAPVLQSPNFQPAANYQIAPADIQGNIAQNFAAQQNAYNQAVGANNAKLGSTAGLVGSLGGAALAAPQTSVIGGLLR